MAVFIDIVLSFPTILFTAALAIATLYWLMVVLGALDIEMLDAGDGLLDGALEGLDGAFDAVDGALDAAEGMVEGVAEGASEALEASIDAAAESAADGAGEAAVSVGLRPLLLVANLFRLGKVPVTVSLTAFAAWGWLVGFVLTWLYQGLPTGVVPHAVFSVGAMVVVIAAATALTNVSVRPLEPVFKVNHARERKSIIGEVCEVTTGRVDASFGQAMAQISSDDLLFQIRCDKPNAMRRGDTALIVHFDGEREAYVVEPLAGAKAQDHRTAQPAVIPTPALVNKEA